MNTQPPIEFQPIEDIRRIDLQRHALIEASAGTGKTYTIENLVIRLLEEEQDLTLEQILLVTFTEKATGELKQRIRRKIEDALDSGRVTGDDARRKLNQALDAFDSAAITTIHGFCHTLLKEFPFETGNLFQQELVDDLPLMEKLLQRQMRSDWPRRFGRRLAALLDLAGFSGAPDRFRETVLNLIRHLSHDPHHQRLIPDPADLDMDTLWREAERAMLSLKALIGDPRQWSAGYGRLNINKRSRDAIVRDVVEPLCQAVAAMDDERPDLQLFRPLVDVLAGRHASGVRQVDRLVPAKWLKAGENMDVCPHLEAVRDRLDELVTCFAQLGHLLTLTTVRQLQADTDALKAEQGWISYQDMLDRVAQFLTGKGSRAGADLIRRRYRVAFVDEFQDTDAVQWRIFSTLFLTDGNTAGGNRLLLIGDPKQSIYAFRGADVFTYLQARHRMADLAAAGRANLYVLQTNWRSSPALVTAFNRLFVQDTWFGRADACDRYEIGYIPSLSPPEAQQPADMAGDRSGQPPVTIVDLTQSPNHLDAKNRLAGFICHEIVNLVNRQDILLEDGPDRERTLHFGDMAILVRGQSEFRQIEPMLVQASIPYAYYRKPGLFQSREAHWLGLALKAICTPHLQSAVNLALLTPFFDLDPATLSSRRAHSADSTVDNLLFHWHDLARERRWGVLFQSLMEASGMIWRHAATPGWERRAANWQQLCDYLEACAYTRNLDIAGLAALLDSLRRSAIDAESDADIHQIEDERQKVQILTMHVSKGLEFPVVFIAGGLTVRADNGLRIYHEAAAHRPEGACRKVIDLTASTGENRAAKEYEDEDKRLYYVALTRSRIKLYIPYFPDPRGHRWIGPVSRFVARSIDRVSADKGDMPPPWQRHAPGPDVTRLEPILEAAPSKVPDLGLPAGRLLPDRTDYRRRRIHLASFSSIAHHIPPIGGDPGKEPFNPLDTDARDADEPQDRLEAGVIEPDASDALPGGTRMGSMFHHIFENIDFGAVADGPPDILSLEPVHELIHAAMDLYRIDTRWASPVARMVAATLRTPLEIDGESLVLGRLEPSKRRHEMEFYFPLAVPPGPDLQLPDLSISADDKGDTFIRGFIDLVFSWQGRFYIADWKSNRLSSGYGRDALAHEIADAGYELQYRLYTIAVLRWLTAQLGSRFDPQRHFGGALYLFIRGAVAPGTGGGMFHVRPEQLLPLDWLQTTIQQQLGGGAW